jgi:hypothetical protein
MNGLSKPTTVTKNSCTIYPFCNENTSDFFREQWLNKQAVRQLTSKEFGNFQGTKMRKKWKKPA